MKTFFDNLPAEIIQHIGLFLDSDIEVEALKESLSGFVNNALSDKSFKAKRRLNVYGYVFPSLLLAILKAENDVYVYRELMKHFCILPVFVDTEFTRRLRDFSERKKQLFNKEVAALLDELFHQLTKGSMIFSNLISWTNYSLHEVRSWLEQETNGWASFPCVRAAIAMEALLVMANSPSCEMIDFRELYEFIVSFSGVPRSEFLCFFNAKTFLSYVFEAKHFIHTAEVIADELIRMGEPLSLIITISRLLKNDESKVKFIEKFTRATTIQKVIKQESKDHVETKWNRVN